MAALHSLNDERVSPDMQLWLRRRNRVCLTCGEEYAWCVCEQSRQTFQDEVRDDDVGVE